MVKNFICTLSVVSAAFGSTREADTAFKEVSKKVSLGSFVPQNIVTFNDIQVSKRIVKDLERLLQAAQKDGFNLKAVSGYRSFDYQKEVFARWVAREKKRNPKLSDLEAEKKANTYSARPGHSEHQLGTVVDILSSENNFRFSLDSSLKYPQWLEKNCSKFNFYISYPKGGTEYVYEPWHLRWYPSPA